MVTQEINRILKRYDNDATDIIAILQDIQRQYRYLPQDVLEHVAKKLDIPISRIYHLATFFRAFSLEPRGKHEIHVCTGTACHVRGAPRILDVLERELNIPAGGTTSDQNFTLETVNCVGACALGPVIIVDGESKGKLNPQRTERLIKQMIPSKSAASKPKKKAAPPKKKAASPKKKAAPSKKKAATSRTVSSVKKKRNTGKKTGSAKAKKKPVVLGKPRKKAAVSSKAKPSSLKKKVAVKKKATKRVTKKARR